MPRTSYACSPIDEALAADVLVRVLDRRDELRAA